MNAPFYFAWVDPTDVTFDPTRHNVWDEKILTFDMAHVEGNVAQLTAEIKNPRIGLLNPSRKQWAWFSWLNVENGHIYPIFFGRLVGLPTNLFAETCTIQLIAKPLDYAEQKQAVADALMVRPYYDPIFLDLASRNDPDAILEGYSRHYCVDRLTLEVTTSDVIIGEDGALEFLETDHFYDSLGLTLQQTPLRKVIVNCQVTWSQLAGGEVSALNNEQVPTYSGASLVGDWPSTGTQLGGGWSVANANAQDKFAADSITTFSQSSHWENKEKKHATGDTMSTSMSTSYPLIHGPCTRVVVTENTTNGVLDPFGDPPLNIPAHTDNTTNVIVQSQVQLDLTLGYAADRPRIENLFITLMADVQPILTLPESPDTPDWETINLSAQVGDPVFAYHWLTDEPFDPADICGYVPGYDPNYTAAAADPNTGQLPLGQYLTSPGEPLYVPIGDPARADYFPQDRGLESIEYLIAIARAHLVIRSRAVQITFGCKAERALDFSLRKSALIHDHRLPGGQAHGKIIEYHITGDGDKGEILGSCVIGCAIGNATTIETSDGEGDYSDDYDDDYEHLMGGVVLIDEGVGDVGYTGPIPEVFDDGIIFPLLWGHAACSGQIVNGFSAQKDIVNRSAGPTSPDDITPPILFEGDSSVHWEMALADLTNGPYSGDYDVETTVLTIPKGIDLSAESTESGSP